MSFAAQARITEDSALIERIAAAAARSGVQSALTWAAAHMWLLSARPGWAEAYAAELDKLGPIEDPAGWVSPIGKDPTVITDAMIAEAVRVILGGGVSDPSQTPAQTPAQTPTQTPPDQVTTQ